MIFENVRNNIRDFIRLLVGSTDNDFEEDVIISNHLSMLIASHLDIFDTVSYCVDRKIKKIVRSSDFALNCFAYAVPEYLDVYSKNLSWISRNQNVDGMSDSFVKASCLFWAMMSEFTIRIDDESYLSANDRFKLYHYNFDVAVQSALALVSNKPVTYSRKKGSRVWNEVVHPSVLVRVPEGLNKNCPLYNQMRDYVCDNIISGDDYKKCIIPTSWFIQLLYLNCRGI